MVLPLLLGSKPLYYNLNKELAHKAGWKIFFIFVRSRAPVYASGRWVDPLHNPAARHIDILRLSPLESYLLWKTLLFAVEIRPSTGNNGTHRRAEFSLFARV